MIAQSDGVPHRNQQRGDDGHEMQRRGWTPSACDLRGDGEVLSPSGGEVVCETGCPGLKTKAGGARCTMSGHGLMRGLRAEIGREGRKRC
jgi:hypothetical protein